MASQASRLEALEERAAALRAELQVLEAQISDAEQNAAAPADAVEAASEAAAGMMHKRPSYSLFGGEGAQEEAPPATRELEAQDGDWEAVLAAHPALEVTPIGSYNHWDRRECAVPEHNAALWRAKCDEHVESMGGRGNLCIPKVIHQIWIGPREPPCLWIDTFRVDYLAAHPSWGFELWSDDRVAKLPMLNEQIYREEKMWQCKADILRLEFLWHYGGLYVDADMISVDMKSLDPIVELGKETGWVIAYEPDTKDKPYSILGNSVIACTPHHPLTLMLILFLKQTFYHKRNHIDVFAVTGPVMYTKCLVDCKMPISIAAQELLYPAFHYVPNPDAINFAQFPKCLMFQFGYTCSGLEGYVKSKNRCKKARLCPFHAKKEWPLGPFKELPSAEEVERQFDASGRPAIPNVIHQLVFNGVEGSSDPVRWRRTWWDDFKRSHPDFEYKVWTKKELLGRKWLCANLYIEPLDDHAATELMLEVILSEGGYYVPLSSTYQATAGRDPFFVPSGEDFVEGVGGVFGAARGSPGCFRRLMDLYDRGQVAPMELAPVAGGPRVVPMGFRDGTIAKVAFRNESKYLGAGQVIALSAGAGNARLEAFSISWAYQGMVPCIAARGATGMRAAINASACKALIVADQETAQLDRLRAELPGLIDQLPHNWDLMLFGVEWATGSEEVVLFHVPPGGRPQHSKVMGVVANFENGPNMNKARAALKACISADGFDPSGLFDLAGRLSLWFGAEKYAGTMEEARIWRSMPVVGRCFTELAGHHPPLHSDRQEWHGNLMKGFRGDRLGFEMVLEPNGGIMFRSWNDDNSTNCEMKTNGAAVEWMKVYYNHQVAKELQNQPIP